jgi:hypothetical protein
VAGMSCPVGDHVKTGSGTLPAVIDESSSGGSCPVGDDVKTGSGTLPAVESSSRGSCAGRVGDSAGGVSELPFFTFRPGLRICGLVLRPHVSLLKSKTKTRM